MSKITKYCFGKNGMPPLRPMQKETAYKLYKKDISIKSFRLKSKVLVAKLNVSICTTPFSISQYVDSDGAITKYPAVGECKRLGGKGGGYKI